MIPDNFKEIYRYLLEINNEWKFINNHQQREVKVIDDFRRRKRLIINSTNLRHLFYHIPNIIYVDHRLMTICHDTIILPDVKNKIKWQFMYDDKIYSI